MSTEELRKAVEYLRSRCPPASLAIAQVVGCIENLEAENARPQSRLAAANALLRDCHGFLVLKGIDLRVMGDPLSLIENIESHLQGAGDEAV